MLITDTLDIGIGLVLVYLLLSIIMTALSEAVEGLLKKRAVDLERAIGELLQAKPAALTEFYQHPLIAALYPGVYPGPKNANTLVSRWFGGRLPSYIPRETFSAVILDMRRTGNGAISDKFGEALDCLAHSSGFDPGAFRTELEKWFDAAMDRASGWYRRRTQARLLLMGLLFAVAANVNSVTIANYLARVPEARKATVEIATRAAKEPGWGSAVKLAQEDGQDDGDGAVVRDAAENTTDEVNNITDASVPESASDNAAQPVGPSTAEMAPPSAATATTQSDVDQLAKDYSVQLARLGLPIGWSSESTHQLLADFPKPKDPHFDRRWWAAGLLMVLGYLITTLAVMLGSPFWFDVLDRLIVIRSTVKPTEKSPDEASKDKAGQSATASAPVPGAPATPAIATVAPSEPIIYG